jgi:hypothetical protein
MIDGTATTAVDACLQVRRVGDETVRTQRFALVVARDGFAAGSAAYALFDTGVRDAGPADPLPVERLVDPDDSAAAGAGGPDDPSDASGMQQVDEPQDRAEGRKVAVTSQQSRVGFQRPREFLLV